MEKVALTYGYIKFTSETDKNDFAYELVCIELMNEWFDEFRTINEMLRDMEVEQHNGFIIVNYLPKSMHYVFNVLNRHLTLAHGIKIKSVDDQIMFLHLVCKLADKDIVNRIFRDTELEFDLETWKKLVDEPIDAKNCFDEKMKLGVYRKIYGSQKPKQNIKFLDFYGLPWFNHHNKHKIYVHHKFARYDTMCEMYCAQHRVFDEANENFYKIMILGGKAVLFCQEGFKDDKYDLSSSFDDYHNSESDYYSSTESDHDEDHELLPTDIDIVAREIIYESQDDDMIVSDSENDKEEPPQLKHEYVNNKKYYNYIIDTVDVHIDNKVVSMKLILTSRKSFWEFEEDLYL